jgi:hypothetical protein
MLYFATNNLRTFNLYNHHNYLLITIYVFTTYLFINLNIVMICIYHNYLSKPIIV